MLQKRPTLKRKKKIDENTPTTTNTRHEKNMLETAKECIQCIQRMKV